LALDSLAEIRKLILDGKQKQAEQLANRVIISKKSHGQMFEPAGELHLVFSGHENYTNYYRELNIEKAVTKTYYTVDGINYTREAIASLPDRVIVVHLTASKPNSISFTAFYSSPQPKVEVKTFQSRQLTFAGTTIDHETVKGMVRYKGIVDFKTNGGSVSSSDTSVIIKNANEVTMTNPVNGAVDVPFGLGVQNFVILFTATVDSSTVSTNQGTNDCTGNVQLSSNNFATCVRSPPVTERAKLRLALRSPCSA
jgi:hypothetical protein